MRDDRSGNVPRLEGSAGTDSPGRTNATVALPVRRVAVATVIPLVALAAQWVLWDYFQPYVWFLFFPAAFLSAWVGGLAGGLAATAVSALLVWYFFMPPMLSFALDQPSAGYSIAVFVAMGCLFSVFHERLRRSMQRTGAALDESRTAQEAMQRIYRKVLEEDEQKTRFFARISHQLRTPLTLILAPLERRLQWRPGDCITEADCRETRSMLHSARMLHRYVIDLLDAARIEAGQMALSCARVDLVPLVRGVASHFESIAAKRHIEYGVSVPDSLFAEVDVEKLHRIALELLANAFASASDGGEVTLRLTETDGTVHLEVRDNGATVPAEIRGGLFERFPERAGDWPRRKNGSVLGLSIVKDLVDLHGGAITADGVPEGGMRFSVSLPAQAPSGALHRQTVAVDEAMVRQVVETLDSDLPAAAGVQWESLEAEGPLVLVVEDDPWMNEFIVSTLSPHYRVCSAFNGEEGADRALTLQPDLIITDLMMPVMNGEEMVEKLRRQSTTADIPIMVVSAGADETTRLDLLTEGVQDYLVKPFSPKEMLARVSGLVKTRRRTLAELERSAGRLRRLAEVVERIAAAHDLPSLMGIVRTAVRELTGADGATLVMRDDGHCHYVDEDAIGPLWKGQRFPLESCISGWTMLHAEAVVIEDIYADPRIPYAAYRTTFVKSLAMVPIGRVQPVGAIGSYWATRHKASTEEVELQQALADAMSVGLANLDLYQQMADARFAAEESAGSARESERRFRRLFEEAPVPLCHVDSRGVVADLNARFGQMFGYGREDVPTLAAWWQRAYPDDAERAEATEAWSGAVERAREAGSDIEAIETCVTCKDGRQRIVLVSGMALGQDLLITFFDVTERRQAEEALRRQAEELIRRNEELERFDRASVGREMEMIKLKQQVNALAVEMGRDAPYSLGFLDGTDASVPRAES